MHSDVCWNDIQNVHYYTAFIQTLCLKKCIHTPTCIILLECYTIIITLAAYCPPLTSHLLLSGDKASVCTLYTLSTTENWTHNPSSVSALLYLGCYTVQGTMCDCAHCDTSVRELSENKSPGVLCVSVAAGRWDNHTAADWANTKAGSTRQEFFFRSVTYVQLS